VSPKPRPEPEPEAPDPARCFELFGHGAALTRVSRALRGGKVPQAWLIAGPPGVGKATLAYRVARYLLRFGATAEGPADLSVAREDPVARQIAAGAHPGLLVLSRTVDERGRLRTVLSVDEIRRLGGFFALTSASGGWRVAIVDSADDMNDNAANALLKLLEEPPPRSLLMLLSHAPGRLLPTIRSRTQRLDLRPLERGEMDAALTFLLPELDAARRAQLAELGEGSPGLAVRLADDDTLKLAREAQGLLDAKRRPDVATLIALAERVARAEDGVSHFGAFLAAALARRIRERAGESAPGLDRWVELWERINTDYERATLVHLEPKQTVLESALALQAVKKGRE
jgi:DNA polymerase-3 subunit delta'